MPHWVLATMVCIAEVGDGWQQSMLAGEHSHHMPAWLIQCGWIHEIDTRKGKYEICWKYLMLAQNINVYRVSWYLSIFIGTSEMRHLCVLKFNILNIMKWWHIVTLNINITTAASPVTAHWPAGQWSLDRDDIFNISLYCWYILCVMMSLVTIMVLVHK